jgi:glycosyltransferase involved in cell wall biosynthesis
MTNISIVIPYYNHGKYIKDTIESLLKSNYNDYEVNIINDGSDEKNTLELNTIVNELNDKRIKIYNQINSGPSTARNFGVQISKGNYIVFLDADDAILPNSLSKMIDNIDGYDIIFGNCEYFGEKTGIKNQYIPTKYYILISNPISICCMINKNVFKSIQFDEKLNMIGLEDWEFFVNCFNKKIQFKHINDILFKIRVLNHSRTYTVANNNLNIAIDYVYTKHIHFVKDNYTEMYYKKMQLLEGIEMKIANFVLSPYRLLKKILKK